jgi:hypothetical protein
MALGGGAMPDPHLMALPRTSLPSESEWPLPLAVWGECVIMLTLGLKIDFGKF